MSTVPELNEEELEDKYTAAYNEIASGDNENKWKYDNAETVTNTKCALVYRNGSFWKGDSTRPRTDDYNTVNPSVLSEMENAGIDVSGLKSVLDSKEGLRKAAAPAGSAASNLINEEVREIEKLYKAYCNGLGREATEKALDDAWMEHTAEKLFEKIKEDVEAIGTAAKQDALACAKNLLQYKGQLASLVEQFWSDVASDSVGLFPSAHDAASLRTPITPPPTRSETVEENLEATIAATDAEIEAENPTSLAYDVDEFGDEIVESTPPPDGVDVEDLQSDQPEPGESVIPLDTTELYAKVQGVVATDTNTRKESQAYPNYMTEGNKSFYWDHILMPESHRLKLKVNEYMPDITTLAGDANNFPHLYGSLAIALANTAEVLIVKMPSEAEVANFEAGADDSTNTIFNNVSQLSDIVNVNDPHIKPPNYNTDLTPSDLIEIVKSSSDRLTSFSPGDSTTKTKQWLVNSFCDILTRLLEKIKEDAQCIKDAKDKFDEELEKIKNAQQAVDVNDGFLPWNNDDRVEDILNQLAANLDDIQLEDFGFGSPAQKALFKEQCFLLAFAAKIASYKRNKLDYGYGDVPANPSGINKRLPYAALQNGKQDPFASKSTFNSSLQISGDPFAFMNKLTQTPNYSEFVDIPHYQLSALQPKIRLYKVIYDTKDQQDNEVLETEVEMKFNSAFTKDELDDVFKSKRSRSAGVGLQNFEFTYDGSNPFAVKKSIKARLSIYSTTFAQLFKERAGSTIKIDSDGTLKKGKDESYRYVDLALKTIKELPENFTNAQEYQRILDENVGLSKLNFRLKAVVGWSMPKGGIPGLSLQQRTRLRNVLSNSYVTLNLTPTIHTFNFDQTGAVTFDIDYLAYIDDFFDDRGFNVFADPTGRIGWQREMRKMKMKTFRSKCSSAEQISDLNEKYKDIVTKETNQSLSSLMSAMMNNNKIFYISLDYNKIQNFVSKGPYHTYESYLLNPTGDIVTTDTQRDERLKEIINTALEEATHRAGQDDSELTAESHQAALGASLYASSPHSNELSFFYLSDLIDVVLENIQLELDYLTANYADTDKKNANTTKRPQENPKKIDISLWEKRLKDLQKFKSNFKRFRVLLGPVELIHHKKTDSKYVESVNMGDVPISVKYFMEWVTGKVFQKDEVFYSLSTFLNQIMNNLVTNFLNNRKCFYFDIKQKVRVNQAAITSYSPPENSSGASHVDEITHLCLKKDKDMKSNSYSGSPTRLNFSDAVVEEYMGVDPLGVDYSSQRPLLNVSGRANEHSSIYPPLSHEINYMTFYASRVNATGAPNRAKDLQKGIFHYLLGQENGILKEIKLQKTQTKGLAEARFEMDGYDGLEQLRVVYDLDIETYANVNAFPGTYIYVPPGGLDPSWKRYNISDTNLRSLGIGGYYMIIRSTHKFGPGEANSTIYAKWVNNLESDYPASEGGAPYNEEASESACSTAASARQEELNKS